jgi:TDG/mug DNA glycosylase family protein
MREATLPARECRGGLIRADKGVRCCSFEVVAGADARVLILGSLPGRVSLERRQYYAQPRNAFWRIMAELAGASLSLWYEDRLRMLIENGIALWDVCASGERLGSSDSAIRLPTVRTNDFSSFLRAHTGVNLICFNGGKAKAIYDLKVRQDPRHLFERLRYAVLPSTSPAHAALTYEQKLASWRKVLGHGPLLDSALLYGSPDQFETTRIQPLPHGGWI